MPERGLLGNDVLAERIKGVRDDVHELGEEQKRTRERLHQVEGLVATLVEDQKQRRREAQRRDRGLELRINTVIAVVAIASLVEPFLFYLATGK